MLMDYAPLLSKEVKRTFERTNICGYDARYTSVKQKVKAKASFNHDMEYIRRILYLHQSFEIIIWHNL